MKQYGHASRSLRAGKLRGLGCVLFAILFAVLTAVVPLSAYAEEGTTDDSVWSYDTGSYTPPGSTTPSDTKPTWTRVGPGEYEMDQDGDGKYEARCVVQGNEVTYYFRVADENAAYYVTETNNRTGTYILQDKDGNPIAYTIINEKITEGEEEITKNPKEVTIQNRKDDYVPPESGDLKLLKIVYDDNRDIVTREEDPTVFSFNVTLRYTLQEDDTDRNLSGTRTYGPIRFTWEEDPDVEGDVIAQATVRIHAGETVILKDIPAGVCYAVSEAPLAGYDGDWNDTEAGTIEDGKEKTAMCINQKTTPPPGGGTPSVDEASLSVTKYVVDQDGDYITDSTEFTFDLFFMDLIPETAYSYRLYETWYPVDDGCTFTSNADGTAELTVKMKNGQYVLFSDLPVGCKYRVTEQAAQDYIASYQLDDFYVTEMFAECEHDSNTTANTPLSTAIETLDADEFDGVDVAFTNRKVEPPPTVPGIDIPVYKIWADAQANDHTGDPVTIFLLQTNDLDDIRGGNVVDSAVLTKDSTVTVPNPDYDPDNAPGEPETIVRNWAYIFEDMPIVDEVGNPLYYYVQEGAIAGYHGLIASEYAQITHTHDETCYADDDPGSLVCTEPETKNDYTKDYSFTVTNITSVEFPMTGSTGVGGYYFGGVLFMSLAVLYYLLPKKKRKGADR